MLEDNKRKSLGRGLGALLGDDIDILNETIPLSGDKKVSLDNLYASPFQPRSEFNQEALDALAQSIKEKGVLQPLLVRDSGNGKYEIIAGERRFRASKIAGLVEVPVIIKNMNDREVLEVALVENLLRENLSAIEEAEALQRLVDEFSHTQEAISQIIGKSRSYIANTLRLLSLPISVQQMVKDNVLSAGHVRPFIGMENAEELANKVASKGLNARQAEELATKYKNPEKNKKIKTRDVDVREIETSLSNRLGLKVKIAAGKNGSGKISLEYANASDLDKIIDILEQRSKLNSTKFSINIVE